MDTEDYTAYRVTPERTRSVSLDDFKMLTISQTIVHCDDPLGSAMGSPDGPKPDNTLPRNVNVQHPLNHQLVIPSFVPRTDSCAQRLEDPLITLAALRKDMENRDATRKTLVMKRDACNRLIDSERLFFCFRTPSKVESSCLARIVYGLAQRHQLCTASGSGMSRFKKP